MLVVSLGKARASANKDRNNANWLDYSFNMRIERSIALQSLVNAPIDI